MHEGDTVLCMSDALQSTRRHIMTKQRSDPQPRFNFDLKLSQPHVFRENIKMQKKTFFYVFCPILFTKTWPEKDCWEHFPHEKKKCKYS